MKYSIITINRNNRDGLRCTIGSVAAQTWRDFEYIVVDGASDDGSVEVIGECASSISDWVSEPDRGIYNAMNKGVARAHGDYCLFLNSGDLLYDNQVLKQMVPHLDGTDVVVGKVVTDGKGSIISPPPAGELTFYHLYSGSIPHQGSFIRRQLLLSHPYDERLKIASDWKFFVEVLIVGNGSIAYVDRIVSSYDLTGYSSTHPKEMWEEKMGVLETLFPPRVLADYRLMKQSECLTQRLTPSLRRSYRVDRLLYRLGRLLLKLRNTLPWKTQ